MQTIFNRVDFLKKEINLKCLNDLFLDKLSDFELNIIIKSSETFDEISSQTKLNILIKFLNKFSHHLKENVNPHIGSSFFAKNLNEIFKIPKTKIVTAISALLFNILLIINNLPDIFI